VNGIVCSVNVIVCSVNGIVCSVNVIVCSVNGIVCSLDLTADATQLNGIMPEPKQYHSELDRREMGLRALGGMAGEAAEKPREGAAYDEAATTIRVNTPPAK
jgi:hypothetical protein